MPSSSLSPNPAMAAAASQPNSPRNNNASEHKGARPAMMRRQSSQTSQTNSRHQMASPGSMGEGPALRHLVKPRHAKIVLPRTQSNSARNLAKLARQSQQLVVEDASSRRHARQRSHETDTDIRLPGSLDESRPPMRRNMTATQLPRNTSHVKLKKNLSHGQLTRLNSGKNLQALSTIAHKAPPSPGLKGRSKRPKSAETTGFGKSVHDHDSDVYLQPREKAKGGSKKVVGFDVGSAGDSSELEDPQMEGSGLQDDEWTEESASVSPYSTRQNTANNSRRTSVTDKPPDRKPSVSSPLKEKPETNIDGASEGEEQQLPTIQSVPAIDDQAPAEFHHSKKPINQHRLSQRSPLHLAKELPNPVARHLLSKGHQLPAPALVSNVSALDDSHSNRGSPAASMHSSRSNIAEASGEHEDPDELVSRFVPSTSEPSTGSGGNTTANTPLSGSVSASTSADGKRIIPERQDKGATQVQVGLASPGSTVSGSSGHATPAHAQSRTELRMAQEKAMADAEAAAPRQPTLPAHKYDRRNETLKTYMSDWGLLTGDQKNALTGHSGAGRGAVIFQGRYRAVNTELRVVQKYRDPVGDSIKRLKAGRKVKWPTQQWQSQAKQQQMKNNASPPKPAGANISMSRSAVNLPLRHAQAVNAMREVASPPVAQSPLKRTSSVHQPQQQQPPNGVHFAGTVGVGEQRHKQKREVSFSQAPPETREFEQEMGPDVIAKQMWDDIGNDED